MIRVLTTFFAWIAVYTSVTVTLLGFRWAEVDFALPVQTLILTAALVPSMVYIIGPFAGRLAHYFMLKAR